MTAAVVLVLALACTGLAHASSAPIPDRQIEFLGEHCVACHGGERPQAGVRLDGHSIEWDGHEAAGMWERVHRALKSGQMPPSGAPQPESDRRAQFAEWLDAELVLHSPVGGAVPRRLNRDEYRNTIRAVFDLPDFVLPESFPADDSLDGFDNVGEGLVLSPPLLAEYLSVATFVADEVFPPPKKGREVEARSYEIGLDAMAASPGRVMDEAALRIPSSRNMANTAAWPQRFEASVSGVYRVTVEVSAFETDRMFYPHRTEPMRMALYARRKAEQTYDAFGQLRELGEFDVQVGGERQTFTADVELVRGETFGVRWVDGPAFSDPPKRDYSPTFLADRLVRSRRYYAAMLEHQGGPRGSTEQDTYAAVLAIMQREDLDLSDPRLDKLPEVWGGGLSSRPHNWIKSFVHEEMLRYGPALDLHTVHVEGPLRLIEDEAMRVRRQRTERVLAVTDPSSSREAQAEAVLRSVLPRVFRRPVGDDLLHGYAALAAGHFAARPDARLQDGLHVALRRALISPHFLYRGLRQGQLDAFDLASRLSYFLTSAPPDDRLVQLASNGSLLRLDVLADEAERLLSDPRHWNFIRNFTGQWLSTRELEGIMPDPRLLRFFDPDRQAMIEETELFFAAILRDNLPMESFIDPGFSYRNDRLNKIYGTEIEGQDMRRVTFEQGGRDGGLLSLASVMMATANGVDTQPVERGVWLLENIFGRPTPPPPPDVPAIAPDTSGTSTVRLQLNAHRADPACAQCHNHIDPLGMVLENFDPVGRWRTSYPVYTKPPDGAEKLEKEFYSTIGEGHTAGPPVDAVGILADGTRLEDVGDLKHYVLDHMDLFSVCVARKLLVYATGRPLSYGDGKVANEVAVDVKTEDGGFRDMVIALVQSKAFLTQ